MAHQSSPELFPSPDAPVTGEETSQAIHVVPCARCKAMLNIPHGVSRFPCPHCGIDLNVHQQEEEVNEEVIEVEREEGEGGTVTETFTDYRPSRLSIGPPHPDPIVETSSLSAVNPPEPTYTILTKNKLLRSKALSCLQIETLVYASQRHLQFLESGVRAGFFIGDGAGVGKGRTIAGLIWENWHHKRKKALWISVGSDLKFDARRDLDDVGAKSIAVHALNKLPYTKLDSKANGIKEGVIFLTYSSLIASSERGRSRLQQLMQWCGQGFDGLLIFDECHKAKNLVPEAGSQPTQTGKAVLEIQEKLPEARVIYCSATGASEPRNMGYMIRLGLWGAGTSFSDFSEFFRAMEKGGVGALELVAMDMKARGMYVCRTLSYKGAEFEVVEAPLEAPMMETYKAAAEFWVQLRSALLSATSLLGSETPTSRLLWRLYWSSHQQFFRHICMSAKVPAVVRLAKQALSEGKSVVIGLQSTGEARTEDAVAKYGFELDDFVSGPRELLLKFVEEHYPLPQKPVTPPEVDSVKELQRKRHLATPGGSFDGRPGKVAKKNAESDEDFETDSGNETAESDDDFQISGSEEDSESDSENESAGFVDEFQNCQICFSEEEKDKLLRCSSCRHLVHSTCLVPPIVHAFEGKWSCYSCGGKPDEYVLAAREELSKRYEEALQCKLKLLEKIRSLDLPNNPLDDIIDQLGGPGKVAEITGRKGMFVRTTGGNGVTYQTRNTKDVSREMVNMNEKQLFMSGEKLVAVISEAGSAGVSLQADRRAANQRRRVHLTLELPWSADRAIQQFGRTHRSNQSSAPEYRLLFTNLGGERRFASVVAKRLESLGALTQGDRRAGPSLSAYNYDSPYGKKALMTLYKGIMGQESLPVLPPGCSAERPDSIQDFIAKAQAAFSSVGLFKEQITGKGKESVKLSGRISDSDMYNVERFLNRLLGMPPEIQNNLFELFVRILELHIQNARFEGLFDNGIVDVKANVIELQGTPKIVHVDHSSGATTILHTFMMNRGLTWEIASALLDEKQKDGRSSLNDGFYESRREWMGRRIYVMAYEGSVAGMYKVFRPAVGEAIREMSLEELKQKYRKVGAIQRARTGWEEAYSASSKQCMHGPKCKYGKFCTVGRSLQEVNVLSGVILPVWGAVDKALRGQARLCDRRLRVVRIETTTDGQRIVGLNIPNGAVGSVLEGLVKAEVKVEVIDV